MASAALNWFYYNGEKKSTQEFETLYRETSPAVYEVIRIVDGKPLFPKEHFERLEGSLASIGQNTPVTYDAFCSSIRELAAANGVKNYNCRMVITGFGKKDDPSDSDRKISVYYFMIPTHYPSEEQYRDGVRVSLLHAVRKDPHSKIWNQELRTAADKMIREENLFEAVLLNEKDQITEGSRSNIFFLRGEEVFTTPAEAVLLGVTRTKVIAACEEAGISVIEKYTDRDSIKDYQAAFVCGTSPKVLPIALFGDVKMDVDHPLLRRIMKLYDDVCRASLG